MVQPKYSPQQALEKMKLMMKYDSSKTLNENRKIISEQETLTKTAIATGAGAATGLGAAALGAGTLAGGSVGTGAMALGTLLGAAEGTGAALALGASVAGGAAALALTPLVVWYMDKDNAKPKVERIIKYCTTDANKIAKVPRKVSDSVIRDLSDQLYDAMKGVGTDEEKVYDAFKKMESASDFCALVNRFNKDYGGEGDLLEWLDDDFDATSEWDQIYRPIRNVVEDTLLTIKDDDKVVKTGTTTTSKYTTCSETLPIKMYCKNSTVSRIQGCLSIKQDGAFGPQTSQALVAKGVDGQLITQSSIDKVCADAVKPEKLTKDVDMEDMGGNSTDYAGIKSSDKSNSEEGING